MNTRILPVRAAVAGLALALPISSWAFSSGSSGVDGALAPTVNTEVVLPVSGILNYTSINIPAGVTVTFKKNATNTPVVLLVSGDATITGAISIAGKTSPPSGAAGTGNLGDDGLPGDGGPGGYAGGRGGQAGAAFAGGDGLGPGAGAGGADVGCGYRNGGSGGAFGSPQGSLGGCGNPGRPGAVSYGSAALLPLVGGSGGGGGAGGPSFAGTGGGGGGGALLIAASGTISVAGTIDANGGVSGASSGDGCGATGGGGSGGAIRLVATTISGNGTISAVGGGATYPSNCSTPFYSYGQAGTVGRIRLEAETFSRTAASSPAHSFSAPGPIFISGLPTLAITSVAGVAVPAAPTGVADVSLPATTVNPVTVAFKTTGVPVGNTVKVTVSPAYGAASSAVSTALTGDTTNATANVSVTLPTGPSTLQATVTYTIVASLGDALSRFAQNERVEKITLTASPGGHSQATLVTISGKEFVAPAEALQIASLGSN